jgi:hypothetical protein
VGEFSQFPVEADSACAWTGAPETAGGALFAGGAIKTTALCALVADALPLELIATTATRSVCPTSLAAGT